MKFKIALAMALLTCSSMGQSTSLFPNEPPDNAHLCASGLIAKFEEGTDQGRLPALQTSGLQINPLSPPRQTQKIVDRARSFNAQRNLDPILRQIGIDRIHKLTFSDQASCLSVMRDLVEDSSVEYVVDPAISNSFGSGRYPDEFLDQLWGLELMQVASLWQVTRGAGVTVAVIDTGIDVDHPELQSSITVDEQGEIIGFNAEDNSNIVTDSTGHGTAVAGIVHATAPDASIMPIKGGLAEVLFAIANGADVINTSFGIERGQISDEGFKYYQAFAMDMLKTAELAGVFVAKAAGNSSQMVKNALPPAVPYGATVTSVQQKLDSSTIIAGEYEPSHFSNYGPGSDVYAPGGDLFQDIEGTGILTLLTTDATSPTAPELFVRDEVFVYITGTSAAAPHVAGLAALVKALNPEWTPEQIRQAIRISALDVFGAGNLYYGEGAANAQAALLTDPPSARIRYPTNGNTVSGAFEIVGMTAAPAGGGYVEVAVEPWGEETPDRVTLSQRPEITDEGGILATLETLRLSEGNHLLSVAVSDQQGLRATDAIMITVDDVGLAVDQKMLYRATDEIKIDIVLNEPTSRNPFGGYTLKVRSMDGNEPFRTLKSEPDWPVNGLQTINMPLYGFISGDYELRIDAQYGSVTKQETLQFTVDNDVLWQLTNLERSPMALEIADIDSDGNKEIIFVENGSFSEPSRVHVLDSSGTPLVGWPQQAYSIDSLLVTDLDGSGNLEIVFPGANESSSLTRELRAYRHDGQPIDGWPAPSQGAFFNSALRSGDVTGDGKPEIVYISNKDNDLQAHVEIFSADGQILEGWPRTFTTEPSGRARRDYDVILADLENHGHDDIIVKSGAWRSDTRIWRVDHTGQIHNGFPATLPSTARCNPEQTVPPNVLAGDMNGDGIKEIVVSNFRIDPQGRVTEACTKDGNGQNIWPTPSWASELADINGDGRKEHVFLHRRGFRPDLDAEIKEQLDINTFYVAYSLHGVTYHGDDLGNHENLEIPIDMNVFNRHLSGPVVADVSGDGAAEILTSGQRLQAWTGDGELGDHFNKKGCPVSHGFQFRVKVDDINNNGSKNVVAFGCDRIVTWEIYAAGEAPPAVSIVDGNQIVVDSDGQPNETLTLVATLPDHHPGVVDSEWLVNGEVVAKGLTGTIQLPDGLTEVIVRVTFSNGEVSTASTKFLIRPAGFLFGDGFEKGLLN